jgi:peptidoglycan biosynthesis protein MviN/MurJ (putative lipid II flippase)
MFLAGGAMLAVAWPLAPWVVALLFERGAFTPADTAAVARLLQLSLTQLPFYCSSMVLVSYLASRGLQRRIAGNGVANFIVKLVALALLSPLLGLEGVAVSTTVMYALALLMLFVFAARP